VLKSGDTGNNNKTPLEKQVEENLRRVYLAKAEEPVPDRFLDLLKQLRDLEESGEQK
jgi:hypothetical protein